MAQASTATQPSCLNDADRADAKVFPLRLSDQSTIRSTLVALAQANLPIEHRLRLMVEYGASVSGLSSDFDHFGGDVSNFSQVFLAKEAQRRFSIALAKRMEQGGEGLSVVAQLAQMRISGEVHWGVDVEFRDSWERGPEERLGSCEQMLRDPESAWRKFRSHVEALDAVLPHHLERFSSTFAANYWSRCRWQSGETLMVHVQRMLVLLASIRLGVATDPDVFAGRAMGRDTAKSRFDTACRRVMWSTLRAYDQHPSFTFVVDSMDPAGGLSETRGLCQI